MLCKFQGAISPLTTICNGRPPVAAPTTSGQVLGFHGSVIQRPPGRSRRAVATATTVGQASPGLEEEAQHQAAGLPQDEMQWTKQWYAVAVENLTDPSRPAPIQLLGQDLVLWRDGAGEWRCFQDRCPHRAAPLSEGKIWEDGTLMCSYHGWRFDSSGACTRIPQAASAEAEALACRSHRACAVAHPTKVAQGIVFVWGEGGPGAEAESETAPLPVDPLLAEAEAKGQSVSHSFPLYHRDLPYDWATLVENVVDPAHVPFSHHGVQGNRNKVKYGDSAMQPLHEPGVLKVHMTNVFGPGNLEFHMPGRIAYTTVQPEEGTFTSFCIYVTPTTPGNSRLIAFTSSTRKSKLLFKAMAALPVWLNHILLRHPVLDGDGVFLHVQEHHIVKRAAASGGSGWREAYYLPTRADTLVAAFRTWLDKAGGGGPFGPLHLAPDYPSLITDRRQLLNRYEQHTKSCVYCSKALVAIERLRSVAAAAAAVAWACALVAANAAYRSGGSRVDVAVSAVIGLVLTFAWRTLGNLAAAFRFQDYVHAER